MYANSLSFSRHPHTAPYNQNGSTSQRIVSRRNVIHNAVEHCFALSATRSTFWGDWRDIVVSWPNLLCDAPKFMVFYVVERPILFGLVVLTTQRLYIGQNTELSHPTRECKAYRMQTRTTTATAAAQRELCFHASSSSSSLSGSH